MKMRLTAVLSFLFCMPGLFVILLSGISLFLPSEELILIAGLGPFDDLVSYKHAGIVYQTR